jgi:hypothetical protein
MIEACHAGKETDEGWDPGNPGVAARQPTDLPYRLLITKQYASVTPQAVAVWSRQLGHETFYAPYYGLGDPGSQLPTDLDIVFVASYSPC